VCSRAVHAVAIGTHWQIAAGVGVSLLALTVNRIGVSLPDSAVDHPTSMARYAERLNVPGAAGSAAGGDP
jgi:hypothetical protein